MVTGHRIIHGVMMIDEKAPPGRPPELCRSSAVKESRWLRLRKYHIRLSHDCSKQAMSNDKHRATVPLFSLW